MDDLTSSSDTQALFQAAADYLASAVTSGDKRFDDKAKLNFYGLYKQGTTGKCTSSKPGFWDMSGRAKWDAWSRHGDMPQETAMQQYIDQLYQLVPDWDAENAAASGTGRKGMGPVFSCLAAVDDANNADDQGPSTIHELVGEDDLEGIRQLIAAGCSVDSRDDARCTALHFAADRGKTHIAQALVQAGADVNAQDDDGQTPLHYGAICEHMEVCKLLIAAGADIQLADSQGQLPRHVGPADWEIW